MKKNIYYVMFGLVLFCSCKNTKPEIESIRIAYYNYIFETSESINCDDIKVTTLPSFENILVYDSKKKDSIVESYIDYQAIFDTIITNSILLKKIEDELILLKTNDSLKSIDSRISATILYKNGKEEKLCIGGIFTNVILYNGQIQETNNKLLYLIKNNIGYYNWISTEDIEYMDELNDTSFEKEPFVESTYYKRYIEAESKMQ
ncbi:MAG: hypothetical protein QM660_15710 [Dysgonomonas sp.]